MGVAIDGGEGPVDVKLHASFMTVREANKGGRWPVASFVGRR